MKKGIEPILQVLSKYLQHRILSYGEVSILRSWLRESETNEDLFDDISNEAKWIAGCPALISRDLEGSLERIRMRLSENSMQV
jgi:hypothetical protein